MPPRIESEQAQTKPEPHLQETLEVVPRPRTFNKLTNLLLVMAIVAGTFTGYLLSVNINSKAAGIPGLKVKDNEIGVDDASTNRDCAKGLLEAADPLDKKIEGSHKLIREGGPSQTIYLTSSVIALDDYIGKEIEVCGETLHSKRVPWLMDVGKLKLL